MVNNRYAHKYQGNNDQDERENSRILRLIGNVPNAGASGGNSARDRATWIVKIEGGDSGLMSLIDIDWIGLDWIGMTC